MERWNPFRDFDNMRQAMDRWMDDRLPNNWLNQSQSSPLSVALDIRETETGYELQASVPGVKPDDLDIQVDREMVTLRGESKAEQSRESQTYIYRERRSGTFFRTVRLPEPVDADKVEATLDHGILTVQLPKLSQSRNRRVQVRSASNQSSTVQSNNSIAATSGNEGGSPQIVQTGGATTMSNQNQGQNQPGERMSDLKEGTTGYGGEKQGLESNRQDSQDPVYREGGLQARGNEATPSSTSGMSDVRTHQSSGLGSGKLGGSPEGGPEENQYNDRAQTPDPH
ncbi:MAG: putative small heat shock protein [Chloroflexi bacterium]|jgi:HSP20 family protein|nr:putative small heat shock protein [Chloroflexota bacterium]